MASELVPFQRGKKWKPGPGRPKTTGIDKIIRRSAKEICRALVFDPEYQAAFKARLIAGDAGAMETLAWHYAFGRPQAELNVNFDLSRLTDEEVAVLARIAPKIA